MRIMVLTPLYAPDGGPSAALYAMLCEGLVRWGHQVTVICAVPHYPSGRVPKEYSQKRISYSRENGVGVARVPVPSLARSKLVLRMLQFLSYQLGASWAGLSRHYDVLLVSNPALEVFLPFGILSVLRHKPAIFSVHDVYPDVGVRLGIFRHRAVIQAVGLLERFCLDHSAIVRVLSESFVPSLRKMGVPESKIALVYDWVDTDLIRPLPRENDFARENGLVNKFVVLYAGNIGLSQGLEHVLAAAKLLAYDENIQFIFVGDGAARRRLVEEADQRVLTNVQFLPFQPRERLPEVLATADVSLVTLQSGIGLDSLPSKSFSILASGRPIMASVDEGSDTWNLVKRAAAGICVPPEDPLKLADAILSLKQNPAECERLGRNGRLYAVKHHSLCSAAEQFEELLLQASNSRKIPPHV